MASKKEAAPGPNQVQLRFNSKLYVRKSIQEALEAYEGYAEGTIAKDGLYYLVTLTILDEETRDVLADEFANYVLGETIEVKRSA